MSEDLIDHWLDPGALEKVVEIDLLEAGHADGAELAGLIGLFQRLPGGEVAFEVAVLSTEFGQGQGLWMIIRSM